MIHYDEDEFFRLLSKVQGTAVHGRGPHRAFLMACFAALVAIGNHVYTIVFIQTKTSLACTSTLSVFNVFLGLLISFRLNSAFTQWRSGVVAMGSVGDAARGIVSSTISFLDFGVDGEEKLRFMAELRRLVCLYVSILVQDARGCAQEDIQVFIDCHLLTDTEAEEMNRCGVISNNEPVLKGRQVSVAQVAPQKLRATIVELWIRRLIQVGHRRNWFGMPQSAALNGNVSALVSLYSTIYNIANIPIPFNYAHFLVLVMVVYLAVYTFVIVQTSNYFTPLWVFGWGLIVFSADDVAREIERPFGTDANDIDLENRIVRIEQELDVVLRSAYFHEASLRAEMMSASASTQSVYIDSGPLTALSEQTIEEPNPVELPMPTAPLLRLMLTQSLSERDVPQGDTPSSNETASESDENAALVPATAPAPGYGSVSSVRDAVWL
ncbi:hypothetical protein AeMF1_009151 [Aphanomyces euteiches]|nr:hypothetical protein AeMF1_009151 [Aphanomyces euteiches]KAH9195827.1 hypothetical protein AeNC1_002175 [Aphanomyces euteiches]